ncbi:Microtubule-associated protein RP/EB family member 1 [Zancudomyces culisetae]|uniref:Microtubule-associated protein RP/EB family member 1 n=1 Tax=Zancudomyces culisetae TaxID=1213189 RepID=A0A1R1PZL5_ZANCU|nr:Microtubule-associated protein RP/EB family member 1 [Zancudomyces culisetae]|eukprot:OMH86377.1 Microtubule-associated protein RP/EB family member 1 [Zancudomyces culisetae]
MELKFQNNFELLQFLKAYWDTHYQGGHYDAEARRKGMQLETRSQPSPRPLSSSSSVRSAPRTTNRTGGISRTTPTSASTNRAAKAPVSRPGPGSAGGANSTANTAALADAHRQIEELKSLLGTSEQERAYYYNKLLSVESILNLEEKSENTEIKALVQRLQDAIYNDGEADMMTGQDSELVNGSEMDTSGYNGTYHGLEQVKEEDEGQEEETF